MSHFSRSTLLFVLASASTSCCMMMGAHAFAPPSMMVVASSSRSAAITMPIASTTPLFLTTLDDEVTTSSSSSISTNFDDDDESADNYLLEASDLEDNDDASSTTTTLGEDAPLPASYISAQRIASLRLTHQRHPTDTGSPEYQIAGMTERISHLTSHLQSHPKDFSTRRGLVALVNKRRRLLNYLYSEDEAKYVEIVGALGIRHKVPGSVPSKEDEYGEFPSQKGGKKGKSKMKK